jgi:3-dehydrotetronate 4-kinase
MASRLLLGAIGDDFTGSTDLANTLVRTGMRTVQLLGVPQRGTPIPDVDALVIALKSRTAPAADAVRESLAALDWLKAAGASQFFFKYCSTFDSTPQGNIGPVADALLEALGAPFTIACPAFPENKRSIYQGHLFVGEQLLSESSMRDHPLTPMTDANLVRVLQAQTAGKVGLVSYVTVNQGAASINAAFESLSRQGVRYAIVDAIEDRHLIEIAGACADLPLVTGGSGIALGLPENFRRKALLAAAHAADQLPSVGGLSAVIAGSCSQATLGQIAAMKKTSAAFYVDALKLGAGGDQANAALEWAKPELEQGPVLVYASAPPEEVKRIQTTLGAQRAGALIEDTLAKVALGLVGAGVRKLVVAGGETSGAVVKALGVRGIRIGPQIDPGVPWTVSMDEPRIALALKSGNFGAEDFFLKALALVK